MTNIKILIPVDDAEKAHAFYRDIMSLKHDDGVYFLTDSSVELQIQLSNEDTYKKYSLEKGKMRHPLFSFFIKDNFLSYCKNLMDNGVTFDLVASHPGGYFARIVDPFGNSFNVECESFTDVDPDINPEIWTSYNRY